MLSLLRWTAAGLALFWLLAFLLERASLYHPPRQMAVTPGDFGLPFAEVELRAEDGVMLHGWYLPHPGARATALYLHGNGENISHVVASAAWRRMVQELGINILLMDYRGYGNSEGRPFELGLYRDARAGLAEARARSGGAPVLVWGHSIGTMVAVDLAANTHVDGVILVAPGASVSEAARDLLGPLHWLYRIMPGLPRQPFASLAKIGAVSAPVLIIHGDADTVLPVRHGRLLYGAAGPAKHLVVVPGAGHMDPWGPVSPALFEAYHQPLAAFVGQVAGR